MSEREFDVYLRLIAKLLRLSDAQREAISDELRDHMENRLEELMEQGLEREAAIHHAIEEFGDAAGLADQFTQITRHYTIRRRIMKTSIGVMATAALVALSFLYMLPTNRPGVSGPAQLIAQQAEVPTENASKTAHTLELLSQRVSVDYGSTPLEGVIDHLSEVTGTNIFVNWNLLEGVGCEHNTPVTLALNDTPATTVLALTFQSLNPTLNAPLDYAVLDDVVVIATAEEIDQMRVVRIYDCLDLMHPEQLKQAQADLETQQLIEADRQAQAEAPSAGRGGYGGGYGSTENGFGGYGGNSGYGEATYGGGMGAEGYGGTAGRGSMRIGNRTVFRANPGHVSHAHADELIGVVHTLLDTSGSVSTYDGMLVVIAGHKTHQRIQETLTLMRATKQQR